MKYRIRVYICLNQNQLVTAKANADEKGLSLVNSSDTESIPGEPNPIPVFRRYPRSVLNALISDPALTEPEIEDVVLEHRSTDNAPSGEIYARPLLLIAYK